MKYIHKLNMAHILYSLVCTPKMLITFIVFYYCLFAQGWRQNTIYYNTKGQGYDWI
jgi:hypothetical protein